MTKRPLAGSWFARLLRERSFQVAVFVWIAASLAAVALSASKSPLNRPALANLPAVAQAIVPLAGLAIVFLQMAVVYFLTRRRAVPDIARRSPLLAKARREIIFLWIYGALVLLSGRWLGLRLFGEGIALHLNGSLFGMTRMPSPTQVWTWAIFNFVLLAVVPYVAFRVRGYSHEALNLRSTNPRNDTLVILVIMAIGSALDLATAGFLKLTGHQMLVGGGLTFVTHLLGTGLPVMVFIYAILFPRYARLAGSPVATLLLGGSSYAALHIFEYWTLYDSTAHACLSVITVALTFVPPGLMKSYLTLRTGNAWVHLWGYHAITPHVTRDTPMVVEVFRIR